MCSAFVGYLELLPVLSFCTMPFEKSKETLEVKPLPESNRSSSRSPRSKDRKKVPSNYASEGVGNHDIFSLPTSDYKILAILTLIAAIVRLFRIYQPTSVVFDEVQSVSFSFFYW